MTPVGRLTATSARAGGGRAPPAPRPALGVAQTPGGSAALPGEGWPGERGRSRDPGGVRGESGGRGRAWPGMERGSESCVRGEGGAARRGTGRQRRKAPPPRLGERRSEGRSPRCGKGSEPAECRGRGRQIRKVRWWEGRPLRRGLRRGRRMIRERAAGRQDTG